MDTGMVFRRYEVKYLLTAKQKEEILAAMEPHMKPDTYGRTTIRNLYYDTDSYRLARASMEKPIYKEKLRVRSYERVRAGDGVFVELKKKYDGVVYKRRIRIAEEAARAYLDRRKTASVQSQITDEIDYFLDFYQTLSPKVFLSYEREAYFNTEPGELRVTFDENILWRETELSLQKGIYGVAILQPGQALLEIKTPGSIPLWMVRALAGAGAARTSFSKYGCAYREICRREKGEVIYA